MEEYPSSIPTETTRKILRRSVFSFLQNYQYFTTTAAILALPFSASVLFSQAMVRSSPFLSIVHHRLTSLFDAAGLLASSSEFFAVLNLKLSQTITCSVLVLPFTFSFLLIAKASAIQAFSQRKPFSSFLPLLLTQLLNSLIILSANATAFFLLFFAFNSLDAFGLSSPKSTLFLSATAAVAYSIILANTIVVCSLALVISGMENCGGHISILKACVLIRGRTATALSLALPVNLALAAVEALFHYRIVRSYHYNNNNRTNTSMALEAMLIAYLYSILIVLDTIVGCVFYRSCKAAVSSRIVSEVWYSYQIEVQEEQEHENTFSIPKSLEELA